MSPRRELIDFLLDRPVGSMLAKVTREVPVVDRLRFLAQEQSFDLILMPAAHARLQSTNLRLDVERLERTSSTSYIEGDSKGIAGAETQWGVFDHCVLFRR